MNQRIPNEIESNDGYVSVRGEYDWESFLFTLLFTH